MFPQRSRHLPGRQLPNVPVPAAWQAEESAPTALLAARDLCRSPWDAPRRAGTAPGVMESSKGVSANGILGWACWSCPPSSPLPFLGMLSSIQPYSHLGCPAEQTAWGCCSHLAVCVMSFTSWLRHRFGVKIAVHFLPPTMQFKHVVKQQRFSGWKAARCERLSRALWFSCLSACSCRGKAEDRG